MANIDKAKAELDKRLRAEEGERLEPYLCDAGKPTIGVGCTEYEDGRKVSLGDPAITMLRSAALLKHHIDDGVGKVLAMVNGACSTNQLVALTICGFNVGWPGLAGSSMVRLHNAGDYDGASRAFRLWNKYRPRPGAPLQDHKALTARRAREAAIYLTADDGQAEPSPQAVEGESKIAASPIAKSGAVTIGAGVLSALAEAGNGIGTLLEPFRAVRSVIVDTLGVPPGWILPAVLIVAGGVVVQWRLRQRKEGWA